MNSEFISSIVKKYDGDATKSDLKYVSRILM